MIPTKEQAWDLLCAYNEGEFHRLHARIVGDVMRYFAAQLGYADEADFWQTVGILHDLDFEQYPEQHCTKEAQILREQGMDERLVHAGCLLTAEHNGSPCRIRCLKVYVARARPMPSSSLLPSLYPLPSP